MTNEASPSAAAPAVRNPGTDITDEGVFVPVGTGVQVLNLEGEFLWSLNPERDGHPHEDGVLVPWPKVLRPHLNGSARLSLTDANGENAIFDDVVSLGNGEGEFTVVDKYGFPVSVDKVGHLQRSFAATNQQIKDEILSGTVKVLDELRDICGVDAYLNYGALLGAVRDGTMIAHDSDTDLCYVSKFDQPADIILESFRMERILRNRGWKVLRMSAGDIKLLLPLSDGRQCHIDVFSAFWINGVFYQFGNRSGHLKKESLLPLGTIELDGYTFPAPRVPEDMMAFLYGENWRIPDPSFAYADPEPGKRRLNGWFRGFRSVMGIWGEFHNGIGIGTEARVRPEQSAFAEWVLAELADEPDAKIADVCAGAARDAVWWTQQGRTVRAYDYSMAGRKAAVALAKEENVDLHVEQLILGEMRTTFKVATELARDPHHMACRLGVNALEDHERLNLWRLARMALRAHGGQLFLEFSAETQDGLRRPSPDRLMRRINPQIIRDEIEAAGGRVEFEEIVEGIDMMEERDPAVCRMRVTFPAPGHRPIDEK
ncbi:class I SAM-dependent methyltransferase [Nocardioides yefusunii]|uniref:Class I SAM-dependent methyltransferase n=1 Tax=Nocardioides yefusunii TaxID=2500546 RepID=A0ABW1QTB9_9ACTN|nr:class I SAM-dependent methyltransferase [Nocardioides yefusunii]